MNETLKAAHIATAESIARNLLKGCRRRAKFAGKATNYLGYKNYEGECFVLSDKKEDLENPLTEKIGNFYAQKVDK